jgi:hypothetical protein
MTDLDASATSDVFTTPRYAELVEINHVCKTRLYHFTVDGMEILIGVLPVWKVTAESITQK